MLLNQHEVFKNAYCVVRLCISKDHWEVSPSNKGGHKNSVNLEESSY